MGCILCQLGVGKTKRRGVLDHTSLRCYTCKKTFDAEMMGDDNCPYCDRELKTPVGWYNTVCVKCGEILG